MRVLTAQAELLLGKTFALAVLVEMQTSPPIFVATCRDDIAWDGNVYLGGRQGGIEQIKDQGGEVVGLTFTLAGVPTALIAVALSEAVQGRRATVSMAIMEPVNQQIADVIELWTGSLDQMPIKEEGETATITVTAEHRGITYARPKGALYSDAVQQAMYPGDRCLEFLTAQSAHVDVWPAASWGRQ
jgi:hypothetical protein